MRNQFKTTINVSRIDICDLLIACTTTKWQAQQTDINNGKKWQDLHDRLLEQLEELDKELDKVISD